MVDVACEECGGTGEVPYQAVSAECQLSNMCPKCFGNGKITVDEEARMMATDLFAKALAGHPDLIEYLMAGDVSFSALIQIKISRQLEELKLFDY